MYYIINYFLDIVKIKTESFLQSKYERRVALYETVKMEAEKRNKSIRQIEADAKVGNGTIEKWKRSSPKLDTLEKVADALGLDVTTLIKRSKK